MALREGNSALQWAAIRPEDITPAVAVAVGHFVQVVRLASGHVGRAHAMNPGKRRPRNRSPVVAKRLPTFSGAPLFVVNTSWFIGINSLRAGAADPPLPLRHVTSTDWRSKSALSQRLAFTPKS